MYTSYMNRDGIGTVIKDPNGYHLCEVNDPTDAERLLVILNKSFLKNMTMAEYTKQFLNTPEKATAFLQGAGILDDKGDLAEPYRE